MAPWTNGGNVWASHPKRRMPRVRRVASRHDHAALAPYALLILDR